MTESIQKKIEADVAEYIHLLAREMVAQDTGRGGRKYRRSAKSEREYLEQLYREHQKAGVEK